MKELISKNPATDEVNWKGFESSPEDIDRAFHTAKAAFKTWKRVSLKERTTILTTFQEILKRNKSTLAETISKESGKPLWESHSEVAAMIEKIPITIEAYRERCQIREEKRGQGKLYTLHKPHGVVGVFGPFNFPGHLPSGHIIPALLSGNTVIFKGSPETPLVSEALDAMWKEAKLPFGVFQLLQGGEEVGKKIASHPHLDGLFFTGSAKVGLQLQQQLASHPEKILVLEMGGNNPLVIDDYEDIEKTVDLVIQSAYLTSGQRCSCARRLIVVLSEENERLIHALIEKIEKIKIGNYLEAPEPFMGPVITTESMEKIYAFQEKLLEHGAEPLVKMRKLFENKPFLTPGLLDVTHVSEREDEECFGPLLQMIRVRNFPEALEEANKTKFGLTAGLISRSERNFNIFFEEINAGVINWNAPLTQASSRAPFGGIGKSGNFHPSGYNAVDYCSYPVASTQA